MVSCGGRFNRSSRGIIMVGRIPAGDQSLVSWACIRLEGLALDAG